MEEPVYNILFSGYMIGLFIGGRNVTEKQKKNKKRRWGWWIFGAAALIVIVLVGLRIINNRQATAEALANLETEPYQRQTLDANIYGTGTVQPSQTAVLTWSASGTVGEVNVSLGEAVEKDQVLMSPGSGVRFGRYSPGSGRCDQRTKQP